MTDDTNGNDANTPNYTTMSKDQKEAMAKLFVEVNGLLSEGVKEILNMEADVVSIVHLAHPEDEPCSGAVVMSNTDDLETTHMVIGHGMVTISKHMLSMVGNTDQPPSTKH